MNPKLYIRLRPGRRVERRHGHWRDGSPVQGTVIEFTKHDAEHGDFYSVEWDRSAETGNLPEPVQREIIKPLKDGKARPLYK